MARFNPYQNSDISESINSIAKALIGSADTDAALARADASTALAGYRNAQTRGENIKSDMLSGLYSKGDSLINDPVFQSSVAKMMNLDTFPANEFGPPAQGQVQLGSDTMGNLARVLLGEYGNAETMSNALGNMVQTGQEVGARNVIMDPDSDLSRVARAMDLLGNTRGKYFDEGLPKYEIDQSNLTDIEKANIVAKSVTDKATIDAKAANYEDDLQFGEGGQGDRDNKAKIEYENYAADAKKQADIEVQKLKSTQDGKEAAAKLAAEVKWEQENNVVVEDGYMVFSPEAAAAYGITSMTTINTNDGEIEVFYIDTNPPNDQDPNRVAVAIAGGDSVIYVDQATLDKIPTENVNGVLTWKEGAKTKGDSGSGSQNANTILVGENLTQQQELNLQSELENKIPVSLPELEDSKMAALESYLIRQIDKKVGKPILDQDGNPTGRNFTLQEVKTSFLNNVLGGGTHIYKFGKNITVPGYFAQRFDVEYDKYKAEPTPAKLKALRKSVTNVYGGMGYSADEVTRILRNFE